MSETSPSNREIVLTGITTTGSPHIGNYVGAIRPALESAAHSPRGPFLDMYCSKDHVFGQTKLVEKLGNNLTGTESSDSKNRQQHYFFLADYHALVKCDKPERVQRSTLEIAATWLALGLDPERTVFYRQSDIPEIPELTWLLTCMAAKGLMNRSHAYKAAVQANEDAGEDPDFAVTMGLFNFPIMMAEEIIMFNANRVPVGRDQIQHLEMTLEMAIFDFNR